MKILIPIDGGSGIPFRVKPPGPPGGVLPGGRETPLVAALFNICWIKNGGKELGGNIDASAAAAGLEFGPNGDTLERGGVEQ